MPSLAVLQSLETEREADEVDRADLLEDTSEAAGRIAELLMASGDDLSAVLEGMQV